MKNEIKEPKIVIIKDLIFTYGDKGDDRAAFKLSNKTYFPRHKSEKGLVIFIENDFQSYFEVGKEYGISGKINLDSNKLPEGDPQKAITPDEINLILESGEQRLIYSLTKGRILIP